MKKTSRSNQSEWEYIGGDGIEVYRCRNCKCFVLVRSEECPKCGKQMKNGGNE